MSEAKFTKGEWIAFYPHELLNSGHVSVENDEGRQICISEVSKSNLEERTANAHLIAAAPEMYEMLDSAMCRLADEVDDEAKRIVKEIIALRKKARGEK